MVNLKNIRLNQIEKYSTWIKNGHFHKPHNMIT